MSYSSFSRMQQYQEFGSAAMAAEANPHRLIAMLYDGLIERLARGIAGIEQGNLQLKLAGINGSIAIVEYLQMILDMERGEDLARRLHALYDYLGVVLARANAENDADRLREAMKLVRTLKDGWDRIALQAAAA